LSTLQSAPKLPIVRNIDEIRIGPRRLTKYERARVIAARALQLAMGAPPLIDITKLNTRDPVLIAEKELSLSILPILIKREKPNGEFQLIPLRILVEAEMRKNRTIGELIKKLFRSED